MKKSKKGKPPKSVVNPEYFPCPDRYVGTVDERDFSLKSLGYQSYNQYLSSDKWKFIRNSLLKKRPRCWCCKAPAKVVHHMSYDVWTMIGWTKRLVTLCKGCHYKAEFEEKSSYTFKITSLEEVNQRLMEMKYGN